MTVGLRIGIFTPTLNGLIMTELAASLMIRLNWYVSLAVSYELGDLIGPITLILTAYVGIYSVNRRLEYVRERRK